MKKISGALRVLETDDEIKRAVEDKRRADKQRRKDREVLARIVTPRASSSSPRTEPRSE